jgi:hypothetical protein
MAAKGWSTHFDDPIPLLRGRQLVTLEDVGKCITKLPKAEHETPEWLAAMEALLLVATHGAPTMFARIATMRALKWRDQEAWKRRSIAASIGTSTCPIMVVPMG